MGKSFVAIFTELYLTKTAYKTVLEEALSSLLEFFDALRSMGSLVQVPHRLRRQVGASLAQKSRDVPFWLLNTDVRSVRGW